MNPYDRTVSAYVGQTTLSPFVLLVSLLFAAIILFTRREYALVPLLVVQSFITMSQRISVAGLDFPVLRLLVCFAILRVIIRKEYAHFAVQKIDGFAVAFGLVSMLAYFLQVPDSSSLTYSLGVFLDTIGAYFAVRLLVRDLGDVRVIAKALVPIGFILVFFFFWESTRAVNLLAQFGGVFSSPIIRDGRLRAQGAYSHPILAGSIWAGYIPIILGFWKDRGRRRPLMLLGAAAGLGISYFCASSTPIMSLAFGVFATVLYFQRKSLNDLKLLALVAMAGLTLFWNRPIWYLFAKIDVTGSSTGFFRYLLIDRFVRNWKSWIAIGIRNTYSWGADLTSLGVMGLADLPNEYVLSGVRGGIVGLVLFIAIIVQAFKQTGNLLRTAPGGEERFQYWQLGVALLVHAFNFLGVSYFGQAKFAWWLILGMIAGIHQCRDLAAGERRASVDPLPSLEPA